MTPRPRLGRLVRGLRGAFLGPLRFCFDNGYLRSSLICDPVGVGGKPLPWITYPAIEFLNGLDWSGSSILEWGMGNSTQWWSERAAQVTSIEDDPDWYQYIQKQLGHLPNVKLHLATRPDEYVQWPDMGQYDLVVVDGQQRYRCTDMSCRIVRPGGGILLDNSERDWRDASPPQQSVIELMAERGWRRIDFHGFGPAVARPHCTSLYLRADECELFRGQKKPVTIPSRIRG